MPRIRPPYSPEFRQQMIELVRAGRTPEELSREFEPSAQAIRNWVRQTGGLASQPSAGRRFASLQETGPTEEE
ncbi:MAG TPA: transposase [Vicinamibacteria bacterium]